MRIALALAVILVAVGGASAQNSTANAPKSYQQRVNEQRGSDMQQAANTIAGAIRDTVQPSPQDKGCNDGSDQRSSDLCAQWKAADAARDAANYALWTLIVSAIGTGLLVWTLAETRANARRELRAYVSVKVISTGMEASGTEVVFSQDAIAINGGSTPAYDFVSFGTIAAWPAEVAAQNLSKTIPIAKDSLDGGFVIHAASETPIAANSPPKLPMTAIDEVLEGRASLYLFGTVSYLDTFGVRRRTDYCYYLASKEFRDSWLMSRAEPERRIPVIWTIAPFHNRAT